MPKRLPLSLSTLLLGELKAIGSELVLFFYCCVARYVLIAFSVRAAPEIGSGDPFLRKSV